MDNPYHELDPDGDIELILRNPNAPFAEWHQQEPLSASQNMSKEEKSKDFMTLFRSLDPGNEPQKLPVHPPEPGKTCGDLMTFASKRHDIAPNDGVEVHMRLSSRHLILASTYFKKMLQGPWEESKTRTLEASGWDPEAMLILMKIIHGRNRGVSRWISLEMLAKIAVLVDYYDCHEVVELFAGFWVQDLNRHLPEEYGRDTILWLLISSVFSLESIFSTITKVIIKEASGPLPTLDLPIPQHIVGK